MDPISRYADFVDTVPLPPDLPAEPGPAARRRPHAAGGPRRLRLPPLLSRAARLCSAIGALLVTVLLVVSQFELAADYLQGADPPARASPARPGAPT
jgi:hypothetical protein